METTEEVVAPPPSPKILCAYSALVDAKTLTPHPGNPNRHPPKQIELFMAILKYQGCRRAVTISKRSGFVTKGHGLLQAWLQAGFAEGIPVDHQDYENEDQELSDIVADNQLGRMSEMDNRLLQEILVKLDTGTFNMELTGFDQVRLEKLFTSFGDSKPPQFAGGDGAPTSGSQATGGGPLAPGSEALPSHVRMVQLFLNVDTQAEFMQISDYFQRYMGTDNVTDTVMEVLRSAYRSHCADNPPVPEAVPGDPAPVPASEGELAPVPG